MLTARLITLANPAKTVYQIDPSRVIIDKALHAVGGWIVNCDYDRDLWNVWRANKTAGLWMRIEDEDTGQIYGGPVYKVKRSGAGNEAGFTFAGPDPNWLIAIEEALPIPSVTNYNSPPHAAESDDRSGVASFVLRDYVDYNIGPQANVDRRAMVSLTPSFLNVGGAVAGSARFHNLFQFLTDLAVEGGVIIDFAATGNAGAVMSVRAPAESGMEFSDARGVVLDFTFEEQGPTANWFYVHGAGEGINRVTSTIAGPQSPRWGGYRISANFDKPNLDTLVEHNDYGVSQVAKHEATQTIKVKSVRGLDEYVFGQDFSLGSIAVAEIDQTKWRMLVVGVRLEFNASGRSEEVELGLVEGLGSNMGEIDDIPMTPRPGGTAPNAGAVIVGAGNREVGDTLPITLTVTAAGPGTVITLQRRDPGVTNWAPAPGTTPYTSPGEIAGVLIPAVTVHDIEGTFEYRFVLVSPGGTDESETVEVTINPTSASGAVYGTGTYGTAVYG